MNRALSALSLAVGLGAAAPMLAATPPPPGQPVMSCPAGAPTTCAEVNGKSYTNGPFDLTASSPGAHHYRVCRSSDTQGWGGCEVIMTQNTGSTYTVSGTDLPTDGWRRAYSFTACDAANNCTLWVDSPKRYVYTDATAPTAPGPTTTTCAYNAGNTCWVTGAFTASVTPATDSGSGIAGYEVCRSNDDAGGWAGCNWFDQVSGTSYPFSGSHLPSDGYQRAYSFRAKDYLRNGTNGWGPWATKLFLRVDRHAPTVSADNASTTWFPSRQTTVSAADATAGAVANSGLATVRYRWNLALDAGCTTGTVTTNGAVLTVPTGDNWLYLCARDNTGRVTAWNGGPYRVDPDIELAIVTDWGDLTTSGSHQEIGYQNGKYFMLVQERGKPHGCLTDHDQIVVYTADELRGPWSLGPKITPCAEDPPNFGPTTWGVGSLWKYGSTWNLTIDAGHAPPPTETDEEKHFVYLIQSTDGINWQPITLSRRIIDGSPLNRLILYTTVVPTGTSRVGLFYWTGIGTWPTQIGYGQIELAPGAGDANGVAVYVLDTAGQYRLLPEDGRVTFDVMHIGSSGNPKPSDATLTSGLSGQLFTQQSQNLGTSFVYEACDPPTSENDPSTTWISWVQTQGFSLTSLTDPRIVLCGNKLCDLSPQLIVEGPAFNPRDGGNSFIFPDLFEDLDGSRYLLVSHDTLCKLTFGSLRPRLFELSY